MQNPRFAAHCSTFVAIITFFVVGMMAGTARSQSAVTQPVINYARIDLIQESSNHKVREDTLEENSITGVYANYSPVKSCQGILVIAEPFDGCGELKRPDGMPTTASIVFLARLSANSTCSAVEQNRNAKAAGALGLINMAPDPSTNYIWILQGTPRDGDMDGERGMIPHVAVSGVSGTRLYSRLIEAPGTVIIDSQTEEPEEGIMVMDLAITIVCITVAVLVLMYAYRVGRSICTNEEVMFIAESIPDPEEQAQVRARVSQILIMDIPVVKYTKDETDNNNRRGDTESNDGIDCAVCLDTLDEGDEVRKLGCNHMFHKDCIDPWLLEHHNCPLCKDDICAPRHLTQRLESVGSNDFVMEIPSNANGEVSGMIEVNLDAMHRLEPRTPTSYDWEWATNGGSQVSQLDVEEGSSSNRDGISLEAYGSEYDVDTPMAPDAAGPPGSVHRWGSENSGSSHSLISANGSSNSLVEGLAYSPESGYRRHNAV